MNVQTAKNAWFQALIISIFALSLVILRVLPLEAADAGSLLKPEHVAAWLSPEGRSDAELQAILGEPRIPDYRHTVVEAA